MQATPTGKQRASIHAGTPFADPSPGGGSLRSCRCLFRLIFCPQNTVGGRNVRFALSSSGFAAFAVYPPPPPMGVRGKKEKGAPLLFSQIVPVGHSIGSSPCQGQAESVARHFDFPFSGPPTAWQSPSSVGGRIPNSRQKSNSCLLSTFHESLLSCNLS